MWSANPETVHLGGNNDGLPFVSNAIPFYWLARMAEEAKQKGTIRIGPPASTNDIEDRYRLVKTWLTQIFLCLRNGLPVLPNLWNNSTAIVSDISSGPMYNSHH